MSSSESLSRRWKQRKRYGRIERRLILKSRSSEGFDDHDRFDYMPETYAHIGVVELSEDFVVNCCPNLNIGAILHQVPLLVTPEKELKENPPQTGKYCKVKGVKPIVKALLINDTLLTSLAPSKESVHRLVAHWSGSCSSGGGSTSSTLPPAIVIGINLGNSTVEAAVMLSANSTGTAALLLMRLSCTKGKEYPPENSGLGLPEIDITEIFGEFAVEAAVLAFALKGCHCEFMAGIVRADNSTGFCDVFETVSASWPFKFLVTYKGVLAGYAVRAKFDGVACVATHVVEMVVPVVLSNPLAVECVGNMTADTLVTAIFVAYPDTGTWWCYQMIV
ncbi:hypothetical protein HDU76_003446 [Blyttiomyces sp. JEL0837]|nr:hypothetical protein HDU76_003446 [Blyttiomyces sp. JEL0837]